MPVILGKGFILNMYFNNLVSFKIQFLTQSTLIRKQNVMNHAHIYPNKMGIKSLRKRHFTF